MTVNNNVNVQQQGQTTSTNSQTVAPKVQSSIQNGKKTSLLTEIVNGHYKDQTDKIRDKSSFYTAVSQSCIANYEQTATKVSELYRDGAISKKDHDTAIIKIVDSYIKNAKKIDFELSKNEVEFGKVAKKICMLTFNSKVLEKLNRSQDKVGRKNYQNPFRKKRCFYRR